jgi:hypothetical protein
MPPKITKTRVPKARQHGVRRFKKSGVYAEVTHRAALDLCKIDTNKLRRLSLPRLNAAIARVGDTRLPWHQKLSAFLRSLHFAKQPMSPAYLDYLKRTESKTEKQARQEDSHNRAQWAKDAERYERQFQELQERAGCKLKTYELVARDAERQGDKRTARKIRRDARQPLRGLRKRR